MITTDRLLKIISDAGLSARSYSGRGMFGKYCVGFYCENLQTAIAGMLPNFTDLEEASLFIDCLKTDNLSCDIIVYWPHYKWVES